MKKTIEFIYKNKSGKLMNVHTIGSRLVNAVIANTVKEGSSTNIIVYEVPEFTFTTDDIGTITIAHTYTEEDGDKIYHVSCNYHDIECMQCELAKAITMCFEYLMQAAEEIHELPAVPEPQQQEYTSAETSINSEKVPTIFNTIINKADKLNICLNNTTIFDNGCGKYPEIISEKLNNYHTGYYGRDPYNQPEHINNMFPIFAMNCIDNRVFTSSNVLNVINGLNNRRAYIDDIKKVMQAGEKLYITVYEGNKSGRGKVTKKRLLAGKQKTCNIYP